MQRLRGSRTAIVTLDRSLTESRQRIRQDFPDYFDLINPSAADLSSVSALLNDNESMLVFYVSEKQRVRVGIGGRRNQLSARGYDSEKSRQKGCQA